MDIRGDEVPPPTLRTSPPSQESRPEAAAVPVPGVDRKDWYTIRETENVLKEEFNRQAGAKKQGDC